MGITDIDDKILTKAKDKGFQAWPEIVSMVRGLEEDFFADMDALNVRRPDAVLRVTEHVNDIIDYVQVLQQKGHAYTAANGVYFDVAQVSTSYGKLGSLPQSSTSSSPPPPLSSPSLLESELILSPSTSQLPSTATSISTSTSTSTEQSDGEREEVEVGIKRDKRDFALWKSVKAEDVGWESPWGRGRPGWHIECSAVTHAYFGSSLDMHSGGVDLKFPHHTNEIAQW